MPTPFYTSVDKLYARLGALQSVTTLSSSDLMEAFIGPVEGRVNAALVRYYTTPVTNSPLLIGIATDLLYAKVLIEHVYTGQTRRESEWPLRIRDMANKTLRELADGTMLLTNSAGTLIEQRNDIARVESSTEDYAPTFHEGHELDQIIDEDKIDDIADDRDFASDRVT